jgi:hypothetical protein
MDVSIRSSTSLRVNCHGSLKGGKILQVTSPGKGFLIIWVSQVLPLLWEWTSL